MTCEDIENMAVISPDWEDCYSKFRKKISDEIIKILTENNLTISEAEDILYYTSNRLREEIKVSFLSR